MIVIEEEEDEGCCNCCCFATKKPLAPVSLANEQFYQILIECASVCCEFVHCTFKCTLLKFKVQITKILKLFPQPGPIPIIDESDDWEFLSMYWWSRYYAMQGNKLIYKTFKKHELPLLVVYEKEIELYFNNFSDSIQQV